MSKLRKPSTYMCRGRIRVAVPGPPPVRMRTISKYVSEPTSMSTDDVMAVSRSCGSVTEKNWRVRPAPSSRAASYSDSGICRAAPW
jgi:hypothetical protein